jgi:hypothetical protein
MEVELLGLGSRNVAPFPFPLRLKISDVDPSPAEMPPICNNKYLSIKYLLSILHFQFPYTYFYASVSIIFDFNINF